MLELLYPENTVWYIEARRWNGTSDAPGDVQADPEKMGSGVVVVLEELDEDRNPLSAPKTRRYLLTCAHVVRQKDDDSLLGEIICFPPGLGYSRTLPGKRKSGDVTDTVTKLARVSALSPCGAVRGARDASLRASPAKDWVLLDIDDPEFQTQGAVLGWADAQRGDLLKTIGYPGGAGTLQARDAARQQGLKAHFWITGNMVLPRAPEGFVVLPEIEPGMLNYGGADETRAGMSGGAIVNATGLLVGIHQSSTDATMNRGAVPVQGLRQWLYEERRLRPLSAAPDDPRHPGRLVGPPQVPKPAATFPQDLRTRIETLNWDQFKGLVAVLGLSEDGFSQDQAKRRPSELEQRIAREGFVFPATTVAACLNVALEAASDSAADRKLLEKKLEEAKQDFAGLGKVTEASAQALINVVQDHLRSIRAAKEIHDLVQHLLAPKLDAYADLANQKLLNAKNWNRARASIAEIGDIVARVENQSGLLRTAWREEMENANAAIRTDLAALQVIFSAMIPVEVDMTTFLDLTLRPYTAQIPSRMQQLLKEEATNIPWNSLAALRPAAAAAAGANEMAFESIQTLLNELVRQQGAWQAVHNELDRLIERLEDFITGLDRARREVPKLAAKIRGAAERVPLAAACVPLAEALEAAVLEVASKQGPPADENEIRHRVQNFTTLVGNEFNTADKRLLGACGDLEKLSTTLTKLL